MGTVDSRRDFDRHFRPTSGRVRERWERLALAQRRGETIPPIDVYRIGELHFVKDGHHRVSIAMAAGEKVIDAYVTEVLTAVPAKGIRGRRDLLMKNYERMFRSRVPLPPQAYTKIVFADPWCYAELGEGVEAWGYRCMQAEHQFLDREQVARRWWSEEYAPVVRMLNAADMVGNRTEAEAYLRVARERYRLMRTHEWSDEIIARLRERDPVASLDGWLPRRRQCAGASRCPPDSARLRPVDGSKTCIVAGRRRAQRRRPRGSWSPRRSWPRRCRRSRRYRLALSPWPARPARPRLRPCSISLVK